MPLVFFISLFREQNKSEMKPVMAPISYSNKIPCYENNVFRYFILNKKYVCGRVSQFKTS